MLPTDCKAHYLSSAFYIGAATGKTPLAKTQLSPNKALSNQKFELTIEPKNRLTIKTGDPE